MKIANDNDDDGNFAGDLGRALVPIIRLFEADDEHAEKLLKVVVEILRPQVQQLMEGRPPIMVDLALDDIRGEAWWAICQEIKWEDRS